MNRAKLIRLSATLANSVSSTRCSAPSLPSLTQVTRFSHLTQPPSLSISRNPGNYVNFPQMYFFSSKPESFIDLVLFSDWSEEIENELEKLKPNLKLTHESIVYVLMKSRKDPQKALGFFKWVRDRSGFDPSFVIYNLLLRILAGHKLMSEFWVVASEMKGKGFCIGKETYLTVHAFLERDKFSVDKVKWIKFSDDLNKSNGENHVVKNIVDVVLGFEWSKDVETKLKGIKFPISEDFISRVFKELFPQPLKALKFFKWVADCQGFKHNAITYNELAKVLAQPECMEEFWVFVKEIRNEGYEMDMETYVKISRHVRDGDAVDLFEYMMDGPYKPSEKDCAVLLRTISLDYDPNMDLVDRVVKKFEADGNTFNKAIYDGIHRSYCKIGRFDEAHKIVEAMRNAGYKPDNIAYSQEVFGLCKLKRFEEATMLMDRMEAEGCAPDLKTWTILIQGYCIAGQLDQALLFFGKMTEKDVNPDADLLDVLLHGFLSLDKVLGAYTFLVGMVEKANLKPWQSTYKYMITKLSEAEKLKEALNLLKMMKEHDYPPFPQPIVQYIAKTGTLEDVDEFLKALDVKGFRSTLAYVHVVKSFFEEGRHSEAKDLIYKSPRQVRVNKTITNLFGSSESPEKREPGVSAVKPRKQTPDERKPGVSFVKP